jgi:phenylacetate-CoA ligase
LLSLREQRFAATLDRVFAAHPYYRRKFAELGLRRGDVRGLADLAKLPVTTKADYVAAPDAFVLGAEGAADDAETVVWDIMYTTGSSGRPTPFVSTAYDFVNILALNRNMLRLRGCCTDRHDPQSLPADALPAWRVRARHERRRRHEHSRRRRAARPRQRAPAGDRLAARRSGGDRGAFARDHSLGRADLHSQDGRAGGRARRQIAGGAARLCHRRRLWRSGAQGPRDRLKRLGAAAPFISVSYGATEMQGGMVECTPGAGNHNPAPDQFLFEAVDPETYAPLPDGEEGLILLTHLDRRGTVMLRYALGDVARLTRVRCPHCGALTERLLTACRGGSMGS